MRSRKILHQFACALLLGVIVGCYATSSDQTVPAGKDASLALIASGLRSPVYLFSPPQDQRLFVVEQPGRIVVIKDGAVLKKPFLDITDRVGAGGERGLLSVAFHPHFSDNGYFFVDFTDKKGDTHIERFSANPKSDEADPKSAKLLLFIKQPFPNHNGGQVLFGPDGMLYIGMGDGGSGGDPFRNGQNRQALLGKLLRIDVDHGDPYSIPVDNPFAEKKDGKGEIWAWGLRNPWRYCFDPVDKLLYIADVGQDKYEEVDVVSQTSAGLNFGWNVMEGQHCFNSPVCSQSGLFQPQLEYNHSVGCCIIGGFVYRGKAIPSLQGDYFYGDYCLGWIRSFRYTDNKVTNRKAWDFGVAGNITSFGVDSGGEIYVLYSNGKIYKIVPAK